MAGRSKTAGAAESLKSPKLAAGVRTLEGNPSGRSRKIAIVVARFNSIVTDRLLAGAVDCLLAHGVKAPAITAVKVPGAVEIPLAAKKLAASKRYGAVVTLGCVIRGDTTHYDYVCSMAAQGVLEASLSTGVPVIFGVLTTENLEQALARAGAVAGTEAGVGNTGEGGNKGWDAALAALEMADLLGRIG